MPQTHRVVLSMLAEPADRILLTRCLLLPSSWPKPLICRLMRRLARIAERQYPPSQPGHRTSREAFGSSPTLRLPLQFRADAATPVGPPTMLVGRQSANQVSRSLALRLRPSRKSLATLRLFD